MSHCLPYRFLMQFDLSGSRGAARRVAILRNAASQTYGPPKLMREQVVRTVAVRKMTGLPVKKPETGVFY